VPVAAGHGSSARPAESEAKWDAGPLPAGRGFAGRAVGHINPARSSAITIRKGYFLEFRPVLTNPGSPGEDEHGALQLRPTLPRGQCLPANGDALDAHAHQRYPDLPGGAAGERRRGHRCRFHSAAHRVGAAPHPALPAEAPLDSGREPSRLGRRRALQSRLPPAPHEPAAPGQRGAAQAARRPHHGAAPRSLAALVGDLGRRRSRGRPLRADLQDPPLHDRRLFGGRPLPDPPIPLARPGDPRGAALHSAPAPFGRGAAPRFAPPAPRPPPALAGRSLRPRAQQRGPGRRACGSRGWAAGGSVLAASAAFGDAPRRPGGAPPHIRVAT
jgi:hypothetical protein